MWGTIDLQEKIDFYLNIFKEKYFYHPNSFPYSRAYTEDKNRKKRGHNENNLFPFSVWRQTFHRARQRKTF